MTLDVAAIQARADAATRGPWAWRGYDDGAIELRARHGGGTRVITTLRSDPCVAETSDNTLVLLQGACGSCRRDYDAADLDEMQRCEKAENRGTIWVNSEHGVVKPINEWAIREVPYRADVADVTHPDAEFIAHSRTDVPDLITALLTSWAAIAERDEIIRRLKEGGS